MTRDELRELLLERFGPLSALERERRVLPPAQEIARRRRVLVDSLSEAT